MSSTITKSQQQQLNLQDNSTPTIRKTKTPTTKTKREHFTRKSSIERLKQFNTFICSQHYYILPALLYWLKSSTTILQATIETCILLAKKFIFNATINLNNRCNNIKMLIAIKYNSLNVIYDTTKHALFVISVYTTIFAIFFQLLLCIYLLSSTFLPGGLIFLFTCVYLISQINFNVLIHMSKKEKQMKIERKTSRRDLYLNQKEIVNRNIIKPKQLLCNRTISNVNLF